ncbi:MAG: carboxypeptidase regulatory-like domain-containing protein [Thermoplasmata archaeon]|nr:carboxypeptidase regulatory-like domain-containing protein [Thermoplasmata archaeon]
MSSRTGWNKWALVSVAMLFVGMFFIPTTGAGSGAGTLQGYILDDRFQPVENVEVKITSAYWGHTYTAYTDDTGYFSVSLPPGSYVISLHPEGYRVKYISPGVVYIKPDETVNVEIGVEKVVGEIEFYGYVKNGDNESIPGAIITAHSSGYTISTTSNASGYYSLSLPRGGYHILVDASGYNYDSRYIVFSNDFQQNITLTRPTGTGYLVYGKVKNSTGAYLNDIKVSLWDVNYNHLVTPDADSFVRNYIFRIKVYPSHFKLIVERAGYRPYIADITISNSDPTWMDTNIVLQEVAGDVIETEVHFGEDFNTSTVVQRWTLSPTTKLYGLNYTAGNPLMQIDRSLGNGDNVIDETEMQRFADYLKSLGPRHYFTDGYFTVNGNAYEYSEGDGFEVDVSDITGPVMDTDMPVVTFTYKYVVKEGFANPESVQVDVLSLDDGESLKFFLPSDYEVLHNFNDEIGVIEEGNVSIFTAYRIYSFTAKIKEPPVAKITIVNPDALHYREEKHYVLNLDDPLNLSAKESYDPVGDIVNFTWKVPRVGEFYGERLNVTFSLDGEYNITLKVVDSSNLESEDWIVIYADGQAPEATAFIQNETGVNVSSADEDETLTFNATLSSDNTEIDTYVWDFGDGTGILSGDVVYHVFRDPGVYNITLNVTDIAGRYSIYTIHNFVVRDRTPPVAIIQPIGTENAVDVDEKVEFNGSQSYDPREKPEDWVYDLSRYLWDFDASDGLWWEQNKTTPDPDEGAIGKIVNHSYSKPGFYTITLNVTDSAGYTDQTNYTLEVRGPDLRVSFVEYKPEEGKIKEGEKLEITVNITNKGSVEAKNFSIWVKVGSKTIKKEFVSSLSPDETYEFKAVWKEPTAGTKVVKVEIDPADTVLESDETNNVYEHTIKVTEKKSTITYWAIGIIVALIVIYVAWSWYYKGELGFEPIVDLFRREKGEVKEKKPEKKPEKKKIKKEEEKVEEEGEKGEKKGKKTEEKKKKKGGKKK